MQPIMTESPGCWIKVAGLNIHYQCPGKGPPIIFIHGGGNDWHEWKNNLAFFAGRFQVYALDLPGFGLSQSPSAPISRSWMTTFLKDFMDTLGIQNTYLIGHSMGAMISIAFAAQYPESVKKLVLIAASGLGKMSRKGRCLFSVFHRIDQWQGKKRGPKYSVGPIEEWLVIDQLAKIESPTLIIWGQNDLYLPVYQSRTAQSLIPGSQLHIFPHCGHAPQREYPAEFNRLVLQFLAGED
jgi:pimeloyl-ACP methyl ester carboxylesterase